MKTTLFKIWFLCWSSVGLAKYNLSTQSVWIASILPIRCRFLTTDESILAARSKQTDASGEDAAICTIIFICSVYTVHSTRCVGVRGLRLPRWSLSALWWSQPVWFCWMTWSVCRSSRLENKTKMNGAEYSKQCLVFRIWWTMAFLEYDGPWRF